MRFRYPFITIYYAISPSQKLDVAGNITAPLYYDRDNTGYYLDPSGTTNVSGLVVNNRLSVSEAGGAYTYITLHDDESPNGVKYIHANSNLIGFLSGAGSWLTYWDNSGNMQNQGTINSIGSVSTPTVCLSGVCKSAWPSGVTWGAQFWVIFDTQNTFAAICPSGSVMVGIRYGGTFGEASGGATVYDSLCQWIN